MRKIDIPTVEIDGEEYPIYCDLYVLSQIQERMDINDFERGIIGVEVVRDEDGNPEHDENGNIHLVRGKYDIGAMIMGLTLMINEGMMIDAEQNGKEYDPVDEKYLARACDMSLVQLSNVIHEAFGRCLISKKNRKKAASRKKNT